MRISDWSSDVCSSDLGPADYYWISWGYANYGACFSLSASVSGGCGLAQGLSACEEECRRYLAGRPIWADPYDVYESLPIDDPIAASEAALSDRKSTRLNSSH